MTDNFNFLGLPLLVKDQITNEIVHNSIPEDRIQLALTSKYCNELVQRAKPKKIIDLFKIQNFLYFIFNANSREYLETNKKLKAILPECQIKRLQLENDPRFSKKDYSEVLDMLLEATKFVTKLDIIPISPAHMDKIVEFYVKLKHLKSVTVGHPELILPCYPSKVKLKLGFGRQPGHFLEDLAEKSRNCPLAFLELDCDVSLEKCQQFLQTANFSTGAEICIWSDLAPRTIHLTYLDHDIFTLEIFLKNSVPIFISQKCVGRNRRVKLKRSIFLGSEFTFNVVSASNPDKNYFSGVFKKLEEKMLITLENVDRDEILTVKFVNERIKWCIGERFVRPMYSAKILESAFPSANFTTSWERVRKINNVIGTNIHFIQAENFIIAVRELQTV